MPKDIFGKLEDLRREEYERRRDLEEDVRDAARSDRSFSLYLINVPLLILAGAIASASDASVGSATSEIVAWISLGLAFFSALLFHRADSAIDFYDNRISIAISEDHYSDRYLREIKYGYQIEDDENVKNILERLYQEELRQIDLYKKSRDESLEEIVNNNEPLFRFLSTHLAGAFSILLLIGFSALLVSRAISVFF